MEQLQDWAVWLNTPWVSFFLLMVGMAALLPALLTLGSGLGESVALVSFGLFFGAKYLAAGHNWVPIALFVVGVGLLAIEVVLVPGMGKPGFLGTLALGAAIVMSFPSFETGCLAVLGSVLSAALGGLAMLKFVPRSRLFRGWMVLEPPQAAPTVATAPTVEESALVGRSGPSLTPLRPAGFIEIDGQRVDVVTEGEFIERGRTVTVVRVEGSRVVVRSASNASKF